MGRIVQKRKTKFRKSKTIKDKSGRRRCKTCGRYM